MEAPRGPVDFVGESPSNLDKSRVGLGGRATKHTQNSGYAHDDDP